MDGQDWTPVTLTGGRGKQQSGIEMTKKNHLAAAAVAAAATRRLEEEDIPKLKKHLSPESRQMLIAKRLERTWKQADLDRQCAFPPNTVRDFESGRAVPTPTQLNVLNRTLGTALKFV
jgi:ribosome-binding protein aMBF1 (putative translation factor)